MDAKALGSKFWEHYRAYNWPELGCTTVSLEESHHEVPELVVYDVSPVCEIRFPYAILTVSDMKWIVSSMIIFDRREYLDVARLS